MTRLGQIIPKPRPKIPPDPHSRLPFIGMDHIDADSFHLVGQDEFAKMKSAGSYFQEGDVLYGRLRPYLNKVHRAKFEGVASAEFIVLPASDFFDGEFIKYLLHRKKFVDFAMSRSSGDRPRVKFDGLAEFEFPLPPLNEQRRIVEKIETLFARLDQGEAALRHTQTLLARYRQSVLKAAVTGALTADWRAENAHRLEHGRDLLARILQTRRDTWQGRGKYKEPTAPDTSNLPELPEGWVWASLDQLSSKIVDGTHHTPEYTDHGVPFLSVKDIRGGKLHFDDTRYISVGTHQELTKRCNPELGDLLVTKSGTIGRTALVAEHGEFSLFVSVALVKPVRHVPGELLKLGFDAWFQTLNVANDITGTAIKNLHLVDLRRVAIPVPPLAEFGDLQRALERLLSEAESVETARQTELTRSAALRQSILKDAFAGKLVPQDPSDEPAAELLARIRASRPAPARKKARA